MTTRSKSMAKVGSMVVQNALSNVVGSLSRSRGRSRTRTTKTKKPKDNMKVHEGYYQTLHYQTLRKIPKIVKELKKTNGMIISSANEIAQYSTEIGLQTPFDRKILADVSTLRGICAVNKKLYLEHTRLETLITNASNAHIFIYVYDCICKKDCDIGPTAAWSEGLINVGAGAGPGIWGARPNTVESFNKFWKVTKRSLNVINPGNVLRLVTMTKHNQIINGEALDDTLTTNYKGGTTFCQMWVIHGPPLNETTDTAAIKLGGVQSINCVSTNDYKYALFNVTNKALAYTNTLSQTAATTLRVMNDDDGGAVNLDRIA